MEIKIALAGNPNCGKTTLFNALTGANQFVGNWPGVTVEKKEGRLKGEKDVIITDLPGIYSLSPYTMEEVVARNVLIDQRPDALLNIIDATNLERNLYLTTQLAELGIPMVVALNMMDVVRKNGDRIDAAKLSNHLGVPVVEISALKGDGVMEAAQRAVQMARSGKKTIPQHRFAGSIEHALAHIEEVVLHDMPEERQRWFAVKIFERDERIIEKLNIPKDKLAHIENDIKACETEMDDDSQSIITAARYTYIASIIDGCVKKSNRGMSTSDKIDRVLTNRILGLPIFAAVMTLVYYIAISTVGGALTDWTNDVFVGEWIVPAAQSFFEGIKYAREGYRLSDISAAVQAYVEANGFSVVREYVGHGIGHQMHEAPEVPNYGKPGHGPRLLRGMTIAVEPMVNAGTAAIRQMPDGWTVRTADGKNAAHYENTVLITDGEPELLTDPEKSLV